MTRLRGYSINMDSSVTVGEKEEEVQVESVQETQIRDVMEPILQKARAQAQEILDTARAQASSLPPSRPVKLSTPASNASKRPSPRAAACSASLPTTAMSKR